MGEFMYMSEFRELVGKDIIVDYPFCGEIQKWSLKNFYIDENGDIKHKRINTLIVERFVANARNPHIDDIPTHG